MPGQTKSMGKKDLEDMWVDFNEEVDLDEDIKGYKPHVTPRDTLSYHLPKQKKSMKAFFDAQDRIIGEDLKRISAQTDIEMTNVSIKAAGLRAKSKNVMKSATVGAMGTLLQGMSSWNQARPAEPKITPSTHNNGSEITDLILISAVQLGLNIDYLCYVFMQNHWINNLDLSNETAVNEILIAQGLDAKMLIKKAYSHEIRDMYSSNTDEAIELSVFGSPTYVVNGDMFYGQDNLPLVERAIQQPFK